MGEALSFPHPAQADTRISENALSYGAFFYYDRIMKTAPLILPYGDDLPVIGDDVFIAPTATLIGKVSLAAQSGIWFGCTLRGDVNEIKIGARTNIQDHTMIHVSSFGHASLIGDDVTVGHMALLHACTVENGAFIGMKACLMDGVVVEENAMVAAGSLVTPGKRIPAGELWGGSPARFMRKLTEEDAKHMRWSAAHYVRLAQAYLSGTTAPRAHSR